jgi:hypothetical protein
MNLYVFRIAKGHGGGEPTNECLIDMKQLETKIKVKLNQINQNIIPYESNNYIDYLHKELWECGKLRQGWGIKGLDLKNFEKDNQKWIENYILGAKEYWGVDISDNYCHVAMGRYNILKHMVQAQTNDIIFIPKHSFNNHHDNNLFTVCKVIGNYYFDLDTKYNDFGHVLVVKDIKSYKYSENTLLPIDFIGYRKALGKIKKNHILYKEKRFVKFLKNNYSLDLE